MTHTESVLSSWEAEQVDPRAVTTLDALTMRIDSATSDADLAALLPEVGALPPRPARLFALRARLHQRMAHHATAGQLTLTSLVTEPGMTWVLASRPDLSADLADQVADQASRLAHAGVPGQVDVLTDLASLPAVGDARRSEYLARASELTA